MTPQPIATLNASVPRRYMAGFVLLSIGGLLLWIGLTKPPASIGWQIYMLGMGGLALWLSVRFWQATAGSILLTPEGLFDDTGHCLVRLDNIEKVERGTFAFKPSNGFLLVLKEKLPRGWQPGLWWCLGRRMGFGGVTPPSQGKFMAEMLAMELAK
ncbi:hypothetical protein AB0T83_17710 [Fluviibacterium sp. DFM31]|uniref:PH domain-containing protein n=1 Tax=Meridianimarinicoccus marinus TaxID=3231483 RepID=A0ABV3LAL8_9RHOB